MSNIVTVTDGTFKKEVLESDRPVVVDFWAAWCGPCVALGPTIEQLARRHDGTVKVAKLNVDENPRSSLVYGIRSIPAVLLFKDGRLASRIVGVQPLESYEEALGKLAA